MRNASPLMSRRAWGRSLRFWGTVGLGLLVVFGLSYGVGLSVGRRLESQAVPVRQLERWDQGKGFTLAERGEGLVERIFGPSGPDKAQVQVAVGEFLTPDGAAEGRPAVFGSRSPGETSPENGSAAEGTDPASAQRAEEERAAALRRLGYGAADGGPVAPGGHGVDLGEYSEADARSLVQRMRSQGRTAHVEETRDPDGTVRYRIRSGTAATAEEAARIGKELRNELQSTPHSPPPTVTAPPTAPTGGPAPESPPSGEKSGPAPQPAGDGGQDGRPIGDL